MADQASDSPILDLLASMNRAGIEASTLDPQSLMLVRLAALVAVDAPPVSYMLNVEMASDVNVDGEQIEGMLAAIAPIVGSARVASAAARWSVRSGSRSASPSSPSKTPDSRRCSATPPVRWEGRRCESEPLDREQVGWSHARSMGPAEPRRWCSCPAQ